MFDFKEIFYVSPVAACMLATDGMVLAVNSAFCQTLGYPESDLLYAPLQQFVATDEGDYQENQIPFRHKLGHVLWLSEHRSVVHDEKKQPGYFICQYHDLTERQRPEQQLASQHDLLKLLHNGMSQFISASNLKETADYLLEGLLELTNSEYGFTGEVHHDDDGKPYLLTHTFSNIGQDEETQSFLDTNAAQFTEIRNLSTLFGDAITNQTVVLSNDPLNDKRSGGIPNGHPGLDCFLGVPIYYGDNMVGMYGIANRAGGYNEELVEFLRPFNTTYGVIIHAQRSMQRETQVIRDLAQAMQQAEAANLAKSTFLSHMSHELRTPLNAILGFAQIMEMEDLPDTLATYVKEIMGSGWHLLDLVDNLLDLTRIETGHIDLKMESISIKAMLKECQSMIEPLLVDRRIRFIPSYQDCDNTILTDRRRLKQLIRSLLSNALKYNRSDGEIEVSCKQTENRLRIVVRDTGQGIPAEHMSRLFTPFDRLGKEGIEGSGTGIGLTLVKRLTERMNGEIGVESTVGVGSRFWVEFPMAQTTDNSITEKQPKDNEGNQDPQTKQTRILYVEDNLANVRLIKGFIAKKEHMQLLTATTATAGLEMAMQQRPDIILMDIKLPDMDGFEALARLRSQPETAGIPVIAVSAVAHEHDIAAGLNAGFYRYLTKPLYLLELEEAMHYALNNGRQRE